MSERFPIGVDSPENQKLERLVEVLNAFVKGVSRVKTGDVFDRVSEWVSASPLEYGIKRKLRLHFLKIRQQPFVAPSDLILDERVLNELWPEEAGDLAAREKKSVEAWIPYLREVVQRGLQFPQSQMTEEMIRADLESIVKAGAFGHWRVQLFFRIKFASALEQDLDPEKIREEFNAYWQKCEEDILRIKGVEGPKEALSDEATRSQPEASAAKPKEKELGKEEADVQGFLEKGRQCVSQSQYAEALHHFKLALTLSPRHAIAKESLQEFYRLLILTDEGLNLLLAEAAKDPQDAFAQLALGDFKMGKGDEEGALRHYRSAAALDANLKPKVALETLAKRLPERARARPPKPVDLFEGLAPLDEGARPIDDSTIARLAKWTLESAPRKVRSVANQVMDFLAHPSKPAAKPSSSIAGVGVGVPVVEESDPGNEMKLCRMKPKGLEESSDFIEGAELKISSSKNVSKKELRPSVAARLAERGVLVDRNHLNLNDLAFLFVETDDVGSLEIMLGEGVDPNTVDPQTSDTLLLRAAGCGHEKVIQFLLGKGAHPDGADSEGWTPLMRTVSLKYFEAAKSLVEGGAKVNKRGPSNRTALHMSAAVGSLEAVSFLLEHKADPTRVDEFGQTPLMDAATWAHWNVVEALIVAASGDLAKQGQALLAWEIGLKNNRIKRMGHQFAGMDVVERNVVDRQARRESGETGIPMRPSFNFIDPDGKPFSEQWLAHMGRSGDFLHVIFESGRHNFITPKGQWLMPEGFDYASPFVEGRAKVLVGGKWNFVTEEGDWLVYSEKIARLPNPRPGQTMRILPEEFEAVEDFKNGVARVKKDGEWYCIDLSGKRIESPRLQPPPPVEPPVPQAKKGHPAIPKGKKPASVEVPAPWMSAPAGTPEHFRSSDTTDPMLAVPIPPIPKLIGIESPEGADKKAEAEAPEESEGGMSALDKNLNRLFGILAMGKDKTKEEKKALEGAVMEFQWLITQFPGEDLKLRAFAPVLRDLWLEGKISIEVLMQVHDLDTERHPESYEAFAETGQTFFDMGTEESLKEAEMFFKKALALNPNPSGRYGFVHQRLFEIPRDLKRLEGLGLISPKK